MTECRLNFTKLPLYKQQIDDCNGHRIQNISGKSSNFRAAGKRVFDVECYE